MRRLPALVAALLLPAAQPLLLSTATLTGVLLVSQAPSKAQSAEAVAKVGQAITVRIEGATQGSGVLVKRDGNRYTVLTAWHVVSGQRPGEELDIYTPDGHRHQMEQGSIKRLGEVDMAVLSFSITNSYEVAQVGDVKSVSSGSGVYVAGFPLPTSAVPTRLWRFLKGDVIANATVPIPNGYQLLYSNPTLPGMSGGAVMNAQGQLVGIHGQGETDSKMSEQQGVAVKTGTNQAVPIAYYSQYSAGAAVVASSAQATTADDYLAQAKALLGKKGSEQEVIRLATQALLLRQSADAYFYLGYAKDDLGDAKGAIAAYNQLLYLKPNDDRALTNIGFAKQAAGDERGATASFEQAIYSNPQNSLAHNGLGVSRYALGDYSGAIRGYDLAIKIDPSFSGAFGNRGLAKSALGDNEGAIADYDKPLALNPQNANAWGGRGLSRAKLGDLDVGCRDMRKSASFGNSTAADFIARFCEPYGF